MLATPSLNNLNFYVTAKHECGYIPSRLATTLFVDPSTRVTSSNYKALSTHGFRRSGNHIYKPQCNQCQACIPVRINVHDFKPNRQQRRCWKKNQALQISRHPARFATSHFRLFAKYLKARHPEGGMDPESEILYRDMVECHWSETEVFEFRYRYALVAVAIVDYAYDGLSAVYTFFDPDYANRSPGGFAILSQIHQARDCGLNWLYLGYWNPLSSKMIYKNQYQPLEYYVNEKWQHEPPHITV